MKKEQWHNLKKDGIHLGILFLMSVIIFKGVFFRESFLGVIRTVFSIFWLFVLPGFFMLSVWRGRMSFLERFFAGCLLGGIVVGIFSYYFGLIGFRLSMQTFIMPFGFCVIGFFLPSFFTFISSEKKSKE